MEALRASYGDTSSDSDSELNNPIITTTSNSNSQSETTHLPLPPPPLSLLNPPYSLGSVDYIPSAQASRVRSFPHVEGNYALHVYIPVFIPSAPKKELAQFLKKISSVLPGLHVVDADVPLSCLHEDDSKLEQVALGREFHISLGRTVPICVHQIDSIVTILRQKLQSQRRYWIDFSKWEVFRNDDFTRSFLSIEIVTGGLPEITKQIQVVNQVYKLHNLPEFYKVWLLTPLTFCHVFVLLSWASTGVYVMLMYAMMNIDTGSTPSYFFDLGIGRHKQLSQESG